MKQLPTERIRAGCEQGGWPCVGSSPQGPEGNKSQWPVVCCTTRALALDQFHPGSVPQLRKYAESKGLSSKVLLTLDNVLATQNPTGQHQTCLAAHSLRSAAGLSQPADQGPRGPVRLMTQARYKKDSQSYQREPPQREHYESQEDAKGRYKKLWENHQAEHNQEIPARDDCPYDVRDFQDL